MRSAAGALSAEGCCSVSSGFRVSLRVCAVDRPWALWTAVPERDSFQCKRGGRRAVWRADPRTFLTVVVGF